MMGRPGHAGGRTDGRPQTLAQELPFNVPVSEAGFRRKLMLYWAAVFFIIAIIAALFGFGGIAAAATDIARILFFVFLVLFVLALLGNFMGGPHAPGV